VTAERALPVRAFQWDVGRQVERIDWLLAQLPRYAAWGYTELYLHLEDAYEFPSVPGVARRDAYSRAQMRRLVDAASRVRIGVVPIVNLLGHTQYLLKVPGLRDLNERRAPDGSPLETGQVCPLHPRLLDVASRLLRDVAPFCTAGKIHAGLDESYHLGRHPLSRAEIARSGLAAHFAGHVRRLHGLAAGMGLRLGMWADMLGLIPEAIPLLPREIIAYDWYYYPFHRHPRIELRNFAPCDLAPRLRKAGIRHWGCPMNGAFRHEPLPIVGERLANIASWWRRCLDTGAEGMLVTSWESNRLAAELPVLVDAAAAGLWLDGEEDPGRLLEAGARRLYGHRGRRVARALAAADRHPFSGYPRWRLNGAWDVAGMDAPLGPWKREVAALGGLAAPGLPGAVRASLRLRSCLAERDLFVRRASRGVGDIRRALAAGRPARAAAMAAELQAEARRFGLVLRRGVLAARAMWRASRDRRVRGPNETLLAADAARLRAWRRWLRRSLRDGNAFGPSPVAGAWELGFTAINFSPALQKAVVETRGPDGRWAGVGGLFLIEFQACAAAPRARRVHRIVVPLPGRLPPREVRLAVRGFGRVRLGKVRLGDGVTTLRPLAAGRGWRVLGMDASRRGYPDFDWDRNRGEWLLRF
jgi:Glycosyl hydrolase family 20, catalytic domain